MNDREHATGVGAEDFDGLLYRAARRVASARKALDAGTMIEFRQAVLDLSQAATELCQLVFPFREAGDDEK